MRRIKPIAVHISFAAAALAASILSPDALHAQSSPATAPAALPPVSEQTLAAATERGRALLQNARWHYPAAYQFFGAAGNRAFVVKPAAGSVYRGGNTVPASQALVALDAASGKQVGDEMPFLGGNAIAPRERLMDIGESNGTIELLEETGAVSTSNVKILLVNGVDKSTKWELPTPDYSALPVFDKDRVILGAKVFPLQAGGSFAGGVPDPPLEPMSVRAVNRATRRPIWSWMLPEGTRATSRPLLGDGKVHFLIDQTFRGQGPGGNRSPRFSLAALDAATGKEVWPPVPLEGSVSPPALGGGLLIVSTATGDLLAFDANTGKQTWRTAIATGTDAAKSRLASQITGSLGAADPNFPARPVIQNDMVCVSVGGRTEPALGPEIRLQSGSLATRYIGGLAGLELHTGRQKWFFRALPVPGLAPLPNVSPQSLDMQLINLQSSGSHIIAQAIYWRSTPQSQVLGCLCLDAQTEKLEWFIPLTITGNTRPDRMAPVVSGGILYLLLPNSMDGQEQGLYAIDLNTPALLK